MMDYTDVTSELCCFRLRLGSIVLEQSSTPFEFTKRKTISSKTNRL